MRMSDKKYHDDLFFSSSSEIPQTNDQLNLENYQCSVPPMSDDELMKLWLPFISIVPMEDQDNHHRQSSFEISSSTKMNPSLDHDNNSNQSGGQKRKHVDIQTKEPAKNKEVGDHPNDCKRKRSNEVQNLNERLRRQKLAKKMKTLQDMIPSSSKRDQASTIDEAIKYIRNLENQLQMMSIGAGYSMFHSPAALMMALPHPGIQIPSLTTSLSFPQPPPTNTSFMFPATQLGLPDPCLFPSSSAANSIQNGGNFFGSSLYATDLHYQSNNHDDTSSSHDAKKMHHS